MLLPITTLAAAAAAQPAPVRIDSGAVQGVVGRDASVTVYRGIPYAAPPVGKLRFRPPAPVAPWTTLRGATIFGPVCPQPAGPGLGSFTISEDCLNLNIWTAATRPGERRPVFVWIYGGGFLQGTGAAPQFDGEGLAKKGVVVVTFNYRTGALGFLATRGLSEESGHNASGNFGLLDDIAVLKWVRRNIGAFGGDPARVTIGGQSAGAGSAGFLAMSPLAKGLFRGAILQSHARHPGDPDLRFLSVSYRRKDEAEATGGAYAKARGASTPAELRALPWQKLVDGSDAVDEAIDTRTTAKPPLFRPVLDGWVLPRSYSETYARRAQSNIVIVAGNNNDETGAVPETAFAALRAQTGAPRAGSPQVNATLSAYRTFGQRKFGAMAEEFFRLYPAATDDEAARASNAQARDNNRVTTWLWAGLWTPGTRQPVYTYFWTHAPPGSDAAMRGAFHGSEINYAFGNLDANNRPWTPEDHAIADLMSSYWANVIKTGNPNGPGLPVWPQWRGTTPMVMELGRLWKPIPVAISAAKIDFWRRFYRMQAQW
jgi:para-nitrobenzyl esterase